MNEEEFYNFDKTSEELLNDCNKKVGTFSDIELGFVSLKIGIKILEEGNNLEKALYFFDRASKAFDTQDNIHRSLDVAFALQVMGHIHLGFDRLFDAVGYLNRSNALLGRLLQDTSCNLKLNLAKKIVHIVLLDLANAYVRGENYKEALPICLKALELHNKWMGHNSVQVAHDRTLLADIYSGLEEHEKALKQDFLALRTFKKHHLNINFISAKVHAADMMIALGRYDEAVGNLKNVLSKKMDEDSEGPRAYVLISMANAYCNQGKFGECKKYLYISLGILRKREYKSPKGVADAYAKIWVQYETMKEFETVISLLKRTLAMVEMLPKEHRHRACVSGKIGSLLLLTDKYQQAIPYFESAVEGFKYSCGPRHFKVGAMYNNLGVAYLELDRPKLAAEMFALAKDIYDASLDPDHADRIAAYQNLSKAHDEMGSYEVAIEFRQLVINAQESHGESAEDELKEAN